MALRGTFSFNGQEYPNGYASVLNYSWQKNQLAQVKIAFYADETAYTLGFQPVKVYDGTIPYDGDVAPIPYFEASDYMKRTFPQMAVITDLVVDAAAVAVRMEPQAPVSPEPSPVYVEKEVLTQDDIDAEATATGSADAE